MLTLRLANIVFAIIMIAACAYFAVVAEGFKAAGLLASSGLPSKFFPQLMLGFTALCAVSVLVLYARRGSAGDDKSQFVFGDGAEARRGLLTMVVMLACYFIWSRFGFVPMAVVLGPLCLIAMGIRNVWTYIIVLVLTALIYVVFTQLLNIRFT